MKYEFAKNRILPCFGTKFLHICFSSTFAKLRKDTITFVTYVCLSVRLFAWNNAAPTVWIPMKFYI
jgi:hypothetical protein